MEERIRNAVGEAFKNVIIERPSNPAHGDYAMFIGMKFAEEVAKNIREKLGSTVAKVEIAGPGFVNITLAPEAIAFAIAEAGTKGAEWGVSNPKSEIRNPKVLIEYTDPNPFKEMHIGHLVPNAIGESLSRLIANTGAIVRRANYQGDVGIHVAKSLYVQMKHGITDPTTADLSTAYPEGSLLYETDPEAKRAIDELNRTIYEKTDPKVNELYMKGRALSLEQFEKIYAILGTKFDYYFFESETGPRGLEIVKAHSEIFEKSEGAIVFKGERYGLHTRVFVNRFGLPTYEAKEIGLAKLKMERSPFDLTITVTGNEIAEYFKVLMKVIELALPELAGKIKQKCHGMLRLASGKMSSRTGKVITATSFLSDMIAKASEKNPDPLIAEQVALGAIKYMILRQAPGSDIIFDPEKSLSLEGDSGPYLQYALVRAKKILAYADNGAGGADDPAEPYAIERLILHYPEVAERAARELAPNLLVNYLTELASAWNAFYATEQVLGSPEETYKQRVARAFANTMTNGLTLLGIPTPDRM